MYQARIKSFLEIAFRSKVKVTLLFLISLGIPSAFLLLLAIRGIENDQALAEQRLLTEHKRIANALVTEVDKEIRLVEDELVSLLREKPYSEEPDLIESRAGVISSVLIDEVFLLRGDDLVYPYAALLYDVDSDQDPGRIQPRPADLERIIDEAEQNEFQLKNYARALELYQSALSTTLSDDTKADLLMRLARVYARMGKLAQALKTFEVVAKRYSTSRLPGGLPGGLAARLELVRFTLRGGNSTLAGSRLSELYQDLLSGSWSLNRFQFRFVRNRIESLALEFSEPVKPVDSDTYRMIEALGRRADSLVFRTDYLLEVSAAALSIILDSTRVAIDSVVSRKRLFVAVNDKRTMLTIAIAAEHRSDADAAVGAIIDQAELAGTVLPRLIESMSLVDNVALMIKSESHATVYGAPPPAGARLTVSSPFEGRFPSWTIELYQVDPHFFESLISGRQSFYIYALITVMLAMIFGAIMTTRMMSRELELARMKSDFVSTVSHEFRSPLTSIRQLAEMLQSGRVLSDERRKRYYDVILEQSERLSLMVSNILDLARIDEQRFNLEYEQVDMKQLLNSIVMRVRNQREVEDISIALNIDDELPLASVDPGAIAHIMSNLIDNAIKYSSERPKVTIAAHSDHHDIVITVEDQGVGIPKGETEKVFERFYRTGDEFTRKVKGSGLGLALVRELVHAHGGTIKLSSEPHKGSTFTIRLPLISDKENKHG